MKKCVWLFASRSKKIPLNNISINYWRRYALTHGVNLTWSVHDNPIYLYLETSLYIKVGLLY